MFVASPLMIPRIWAMPLPIPLLMSSFATWNIKLDTPTAIGQLEQLASQIGEVARTGQNVQAAQTTLRTLGQIFGLRLNAPHAEERVITHWNEHLKRFAHE